MKKKKEKKQTNKRTQNKKKISLTVIFGIDLFIISVRAILVFWQYLSPKSVMQ